MFSDKQDLSNGQGNIFNYSSSIVLLISIILYLYYLILDYKDQEQTERPKSKTIWVYGFFILLILGFFISSYPIVFRGRL